MTHEEKNIGGGAEHPGSDEQKISMLLSGLKRVEAPKDFDFHVKARIANAKPAEYRPAGLFPILKYALPLGLFVAVGAGVVVNSSYNGWQNLTAADASNRNEHRTQANGIPEPRVSPESAALPGTGAPDPALAAGPSQDVPVRPEVPVRGPKDLVTPAPPERPIGYSDSALKPAPTPIIPPEFRGNSNTSSNSNVAPTEMAAKPLAVRDALQSIGIEVELEENKWKVKSVKASSIGEMLGAKAGDKLESIDGRGVDDKTVYKDGSFKVKTIRVRRGEMAVDLHMKKPQK